MLDCTGFAKLGVDVTLITPHVHRPEYPVRKHEIWHQYGLTQRFRIVELPTYYGDEGPGAGRWYIALVRAQKLLAGTLYALGLALISLVRRPRRIFIIHCLATGLPFVALARIRALGWNCFLIVPAFLEPRRLERWFASNCVGTLALNEACYNGVVASYGLEPSRVFRQWPYSYLEVFDELSIDQPLLLPDRGRGLVVYVGKVGYPPHREIELLLETARLLRSHRFLLVGGNGESERVWAERASEAGIENVTWLGFQPLPSLLPLVRSANVLVSYYSATDPLAEQNRVPAKFALYRCAAKPIVAADFPGIREVLGEDEAWFAPPDRPEELARVIEHALNFPGEAAEKGRRAFERARENGISRYCAEVLAFMERLAAAPGRTHIDATERTAEP